MMDGFVSRNVGCRPYQYKKVNPTMTLADIEAQIKCNCEKGDEVIKALSRHLCTSFNCPWQKEKSQIKRLSKNVGES